MMAADPVNQIEETYKYVIVQCLILKQSFSDSISELVKNVNYV